MIERGARRRAASAARSRSVLTASESIIYKRFGYGAATWRLGCSLDRAATPGSRGRSPTPGRVRLVRARRGRPRSTARSTSACASAGPAWSPGPTPGGPRCSGCTEAGRALFDAVHEDAARSRRRLRLLRDQGRVVRRLRRPRAVRLGSPGDQPARARRAVGVRVRRRPRREDRRDEPAARRAAAFHARRPAPAAHRVLQRLAVGAAARRRGAARGAHVLDAGQARRSRSSIPTASRVAVRARRRPRRRELPASSRARRPTSPARGRRSARCSLGGNSWATLAEAGEVDEHTPGAVARADAMFATAPAPATLTWF